MNSLYNNANTQPICTGNSVRQNSTLGIAPLPTLGGWKIWTADNKSIPTYELISDQVRSLPIESSLLLSETNTLFLNYTQNTGYISIFDTPSSRDEPQTTDGDTGQSIPILPVNHPEMRAHYTNFETVL